MTLKASFSSGTHAAEIAVGLVLLALSAAVLVLAGKMPIGTLASPGPAVFPLGLGGTLFLVSIGLLIRALRLRGEEADQRISIGHKDVWIALIALVVLALVFELVGYLISAFLFMAVLLRSFSPLNWWRIGIGALLASSISWFLFVKLLGVNLPAGLL